MEYLASYSLSDFILFSRETYFRQFELYNAAYWPLHVFALTFALVIFYALKKRRPCSGQQISLVLAVSWIWVAVAFIYQYFYQIHFAADWYSYVFILQAGMMTWYGTLSCQSLQFNDNPKMARAGTALLFIAIFIYPFITFLAGRSWMQTEMFAMAPDPTALTTIGIFLFYRTPPILYVIPVLWLLLSYTTLIVM